MGAVGCFVLGFVLGYVSFRKIVVAFGCAVLAAVGMIAFLAWDQKRKQAEDEAQRGAPRRTVPRSLIGTWEGGVSDRGKLRVMVEADDRGSAVAEIWNPEELVECVEIGRLEVIGEGLVSLDSPDTAVTLSRVTPVPGPSVSAVVGAWRGTYTCGQGRTGMTLTIRRAAGSRVTARLAFYPVRGNPDVERGSSAKQGIYRAGRLTLHHDHWIDKPHDYRGVGLSAEIKGTTPRQITARCTAPTAPPSR